LAIDALREYERSEKDENVFAIAIFAIAIYP
jgi:hypothetical protein